MALRYANKRVAFYATSPKGHATLCELSPPDLNLPPAPAFARLHAKHRRHFAFTRRTISIPPLVIEAKTWLTDSGLRGNLRLKMFVRFKVGFGGKILHLTDRFLQQAKQEWQTRTTSKQRIVACCLRVKIRHSVHPVQPHMACGSAAMCSVLVETMFSLTKTP